MNGKKMGRRFSRFSCMPSLRGFMKEIKRICIFTAVCAWAFAASMTRGAQTPIVDVILWFDTEDYLLPASDDAAKRLAQMLTERKIHATFKVVGEKARTLERRGRHDVISALKKHTIAYHSDFHSVHPTPTEYLANAGLLDGIAEFVRREGDGAADVRRIFGVKTLACYGQPGSSWAAQAVAGVKQIGVAPSGVPCYVDEGTHVGWSGKPFWYAGTLNVYHMGENYTRMELHDPAAVESAKKKVAGIATRLAGEGGGLISIFYHPCEWVHQQFWDGVNFARGANPPRAEWKAPPQRTAEETDGAFRRFGEYIDYIHSLPGVRFITAVDLPKLYPDGTQTEGATEEDLARIAAGICTGTNGLDAQVIGQRSYSLADQFELLSHAVAAKCAQTKLRFPLRTSGLLGPDVPPPTNSSVRQINTAAFAEAVADGWSFMQSEHRVPSQVFIGADAVAPADFLAALAHAYQAEPGLSEQLEVPASTALLPERRIAKDTPGLFGGWVIHKEGFRAPKVMEVARLQAWTLKPAVPTTERHL